jgi:hypothetical protein
MHIGATLLLAAVFCTEVSMSNDGPSTRQDRPGDSWIAITDYRNTDENERQIDRLLSAAQVPFHFIRVHKGWSQRTDVMDVIVPPDRAAQAEAVLSAAADAGVLERASGTARP